MSSRLQIQMNIFTTVVSSKRKFIKNRKSTQVGNVFLTDKKNMIRWCIQLKRQIITEDNRKIQVLRVPFYYQSNQDALCFVFSLKMCIEYFKNIFENDFIRSKTPNLSVEDIRQLTHTDEFLGTRVDRSLMKELSREIPSLNFSLRERCSIDIIKTNFKKNLPTIILYNCSYMIYNEPGPGHAGVVIGIIDDNDLVLNNPWLGPEKLIKWKELEKGWELEYKKAVIMQPELQTKVEDF